MRSNYFCKVGAFRAQRILREPCLPASPEHRRESNREHLAQVAVRESILLVSDGRFAVFSGVRFRMWRKIR